MRFALRAVVSRRQFGLSGKIEEMAVFCDFCNYCSSENNCPLSHPSGGAATLQPICRYVPSVGERIALKVPHCLHRWRSDGQAEDARCILPNV